ncbi:MAG: type I-U CRISPR-associated protein Csb2, partial [Thaumarchaeota archaeon]|nr:type I-U CRISPR-associated protein Csb2 [Nitrososphaerota archaeon]
DSISVTTKQLQDSNYVDPPGGRWVQYTRPQNCFEGKTSHDTKTAYMSNITLVRYAIVGPVRPSIVDTLRVGDVARKACMSKYGKKNNNNVSATFSGKDGEGNPLSGHQHAFYLPTYETQNQEIDHLTIIASKQFDKDELDALFSLKRLFGYNTMDVRLVFQGCGTPDNFSNIPILQKSHVWASATPVVLSRHIKYRRKGSNTFQIDGPKEQIRNEIEKRYGTSYVLKKITIKQDDQVNLYNTRHRPSDFFRWRKHGSIGDGKSYNIQLEFKEPVKGPITLGYSSHFGLGMFVPEEER